MQQSTNDENLHAISGHVRRYSLHIRKKSILFFLFFFIEKSLNNSISLLIGLLKCDL
jgi:hypothetical protein